MRLEELAKAAQTAGSDCGDAEAGARPKRFAEAVAASHNWDKTRIDRLHSSRSMRLRGAIGKAVRATASSSGRAQPARRAIWSMTRWAAVLQVPGWSNIFTQPIINRIDMLSTGVRTDIGVKVFGADLDTIDRVCKEIEAALKPLNGARDVIAAPIMGKGYLEIDIDREAGRPLWHLVEDIQNEIEVALAGRAVTYTVEKRERFPVRIRYARADREDEESIRRLLISPSGIGRSRSGCRCHRLDGSKSVCLSAATPGTMRRCRLRGARRQRRRMRSRASR